MPDWPFEIPPGAAVITTTYVTRQHLPVLDVLHEIEDDDVFWQFHCGNGDFDPAVLQLVRLDELLAIDSALAELATLPAGHRAVFSAVGAPWIVRPVPTP
jgi:hypothetical protein